MANPISHAPIIHPAQQSNRLLAERALASREIVNKSRAATRRERSVTVNLAESPLGWLAAHGHVSTRQLHAGERLRDDWTIAGLDPRITMRWEGMPVARGRRGPDAPLDPTLAKIAAKRRFDEALAAVGPGLSDILWRVACAGEGVSDAETTLGWPRRAGKLVLGLALDRLAQYYRL
jgi:hypothetical protein